MGMPQTVLDVAGSPGILQGLATIFSAWVGMFAHLIKKNVSGETFGHCRAYVRLHFKTVLISSVFAVGAALGVVAVQAADASIWALASAGFTTGWTIDSAMEISRKAKELGQ